MPWTGSAVVPAVNQMAEFLGCCLLLLLCRGRNDVELTFLLLEKMSTVVECALRELG